MSEPHCGCNCCERHLNVREVLPGRTDTERLDWMIKREAKIIYSIYQNEIVYSTNLSRHADWFKTPREAIDAAMDQEGK